MGVLVWQSSLVSGGTTGTTTITGFGGTNAGTDNYGVNVQHVNSAITSAGSNVVVTGTGGGTGASTQNIGVAVFSSGQIAAGGSGTVTVTGFGGNPSGTGGTNVGIFVGDPATTITSNGGAVSLTGTGGSQTGSGVSNAGIQLTTSATVTAGGGNISLTGTGGGGAASNTNRGLQLQNSGVIAATGTGTVTLIGIGGGGTGNSHGTRIVQNASVTAVNGNISITGSVTDGTTATQGFTLSNAAAIGAKVETSGSAAITVAADSMDISTSGVTMNAGSNTVTLRQKTNAVAINLGSIVDTTPSTLELSQGELGVITAGTLNIGDANSGAITESTAITRTAATNVTLNSGSTIAITTGPLNTGGGNLTVNPGGATNTFGPLAVGTDVNLGTGATPGTLGFGSGDKLAITITGLTPDSQFTQLKVTGKVDLTGAALVLSGGYVPLATDTFIIIDNDTNADAVTGTFAGLPEGAAVTFNGVSLSITYHGGDGNDVVLTANRPPVAGPVTIARYPTQPVKISVAQLFVAGAVSDPDLLDTVTLAGVSGGTHGTPTVSGGYVFYTPFVNDLNPDSFTYTVQDNHGAQTSATVTVTIVVDNAPTNNITKFVHPPGGPVDIDFAGIPGLTYGVQYKLNLGAPSWTPIGTLLMNSFGAAHFTDNDPVRKAAPTGFYRFVFPAPFAP